MVGVNGRTAHAAGEDAEVSDILGDIEFDDDTSRPVDLFGSDECSGGLQLSLRDISTGPRHLGLKETTGHGGQDHFGVRPLDDALGAVLKEGGGKGHVLGMEENHDGTQRHRNHIHARTQKHLCDGTVRGRAHHCLLQIVAGGVEVRLDAGHIGIDASDGGRGLQFRPGRLGLRGFRLAARGEVALLGLFELRLRDRAAFEEYL